MKKTRRKEGSVYPRPNSPFLYMKYRDENDALVQMSTEQSDQVRAEQVLEATLQRVRALKEILANNPSIPAPSGPITVDWYATQWIAGRRRRGMLGAGDDNARLRHALPTLGPLKMKEVRPRHVRDLIRALSQKVGPNKGDMAPRTVRHVYGILHTMFEEAVADEILPANPCVLKRGELPKKKDKVPHAMWRKGAMFVREEVEQLISDERVPEDRRMFYGLSFLSGMRTGEASAQRWRHYEPDAEPLGSLDIAFSYNTKHKIEKPVKTEEPRKVPVHPTLAKMLAAWKLGGWRRMMGRDPTPDDLIVPSRLGRNRTTNHMLKKLHEDLERLGMRRRNQYDSRATFITLCQTDGARDDILKWATHAPPGTVFGGYTRFQWDTLSAEVAKLRIRLLEGKLLRLRKVAGVEQAPETKLHSKLHSTRYSQKSKQSDALPGTKQVEAAGIESASPQATSGIEGSQETPRPRFLGICPDGDGVGRTGEESQCSGVAEPSLLSVARELLEHHRQAPRHTDPCELCERAEAAIARGEVPRG